MLIYGNDSVASVIQKWIWAHGLETNHWVHVCDGLSEHA